ncbi:MAG: hypothetical protein MUP76_05500 [Acidimicrobiia bacterium]|nr:hypothetical protein [Acidimicrobiia bacterium]
MYGGSAPKGQNTDPRAGRVRQEEMFRAGGGGRPPWAALLVIGGAIAVILAVVLVVTLARDGEGLVEDPPRSDVMGVALDCSPDDVIETIIEGGGRNPKEILQAADPAVVSVVRDEAGPARWWGYDAESRAVVRLTDSGAADRYEVAACRG